MFIFYFSAAFAEKSAVRMNDFVVVYFNIQYHRKAGMQILTVGVVYLCTEIRAFFAHTSFVNVISSTFI